MEYYQYQKEGIEWLKSHFKCLLADEMGLGKTVQVVGLVNSCPGIQRVIVVCPASLKLNWLREFKAWGTRGLSFQVLSGTPKRGDKLDGDVMIVNYDILSKWKDRLLGVVWDVVVFDEAHYLKNIKAERTRAGLKLNANRVVFMTGTPIVNRPAEMFNMLCKLGLFTNRKSFEIRYCDAKHVRKFGMRIWDNSGSSNMDELAEKIKPVMLRRVKKDVLKELPDKIHQVIELSGCRDILDKVEWHNELPKHGSVTPEVRRLAGENKIFPAAAHIKGLLEEKPKVIVFAHHKSVIGGLLQYLVSYNPLTITGSTSATMRQRAVDLFQTSPTHRVIVCNIQAAGVGITLTAADVVVFVELDWTPGNMKQAEDRAHRIGQKNNVLVQYLVAEGADADIGRALAKKIKNMEAIGC